MDLTRRRLLASGLASAGALIWPESKVLAQSGIKLLTAPKLALIIGNSKYRHSPLKNPANDASGMGAALQDVGFTVSVHYDVSQAALRDAIHAFGERLGTHKGIGLFYFAGHGAQLAWRNYLIPVDAEISHVQELRERAVDVNSLIEGIRKAGNPMNVLILDACRDNPFGSTTRLEQKGLSQLDAPPGTLLAYATAPGNTAIDGDGGKHGLYTEHLLREIKVPEAKVEDVFKRVRLGVRRRSKGLQIPWESTSLEEDFWFIPPKEIKKLAEADLEREFKQELAVWEKIQSSTVPEPFEDYLRRYPNGRFTELAQLRLDRVLAKAGEKKIEILSSPENPYTKGTVRANTAYRIGDAYSYRVLDVLTGIEVESYTYTVTEITENEIYYTAGLVTDLLGNPLKSPRLIRSPSQMVPTDFTVGKRWNTRFNVEYVKARRHSVVDLEVRVADRETITVPAGTFDAYRVEAHGWASGSVNDHWTSKRWYAPDKVRYFILSEFEIKTGPIRTGKVRTSRRSELVDFKQS